MKETYETDLRTRYPASAPMKAMCIRKRPTCSLSHVPMKETYEKDLEKRPTKETYESDVHTQETYVFPIPCTDERDL